jgi:hypothetical protein
LVTAQYLVAVHRFARCVRLGALVEGPRRANRFSWKREVALGLGLYAVYLTVRRLALAGEGRARAEYNAQRVVAAEERLGLHVEPRLQQLVLPSRKIVQALNLGYATLNVGLTVGWLIVLFRRRHPLFHRYRRTALVTVLGAQPVFLLFPVAPPRKLEHLVDTIAEVSGFDLDTGLIEKLYHPLAALPSIHVAIAEVTAAGLRDTTRSPAVRALAPLYPPLVAAVVLLTANHYVVDVLAGSALGRAALRIARLFERPPQRSA